MNKKANKMKQKYYKMTFKKKIILMKIINLKIQYKVKFQI